MLASVGVRHLQRDQYLLLTTSAGCVVGRGVFGLAGFIRFRSSLAVLQ